MTLNITDGEIPVLFAEMVQNRTVLDHPSIKQLQPLSELEHDKELDLVITPTPGVTIESDPNVLGNNRHLLLPLAQRASFWEDPNKVSLLI